MAIGHERNLRRAAYGALAGERLLVEECLAPVERDDERVILQYDFFELQRGGCVGDAVAKKCVEDKISKIIIKVPPSCLTNPKASLSVDPLNLAPATERATAKERCRASFNEQRTLTPTKSQKKMRLTE